MTKIYLKSKCTFQYIVKIVTFKYNIVFVSQTEQISHKLINYEVVKLW